MPPSPESGLKILIEEARRRQDDTRPDMLRLLAKFYLAAATHSEEEQTRFATLALRLINAVSVPTAAPVVRSLAPRADLPRDFVLHLAKGPLAIAGPILRQSPLLDEPTLLDIAKTASAEHLAAIAVRRDVSPALAKKLAAMMHEEGETASVEAAIADATFVDSVVHGETTNELIPGKADGSEVEGAAAPVPREAVVAEVAVAGSMVETAAPGLAPPAEPTEAETLPVTAESDEVRATPLRPNFFMASPEERTVILARLVTLAPLPLAERVAAPAPELADALLDAAKADDRETIVALIKDALGISAENAAQIIADGSGQAFAVAARALGLSFAILSRVLFRLHPVTGRSAADMARLAEMFDNLPNASAQHLIASWRGAAKRALVRGEDEAPSMRDFGLARPAASAPAAEKVEKLRQ